MEREAWQGSASKVGKVWEKKRGAKKRKKRDQRNQKGKRKKLVSLTGPASEKGNQETRCGEGWGSGRGGENKWVRKTE